MRYLTAVITLALLLTSCDTDPTSPDTPGTKGTISGNVHVYDKTLTRLSDRSGVVVTYVDVNGKSYTATTQPDGMWKMELPYGVYRLVSITKDGHTYLDCGSGKQYPLTGHLDWLGQGERQVVFNTRLMPVELDTPSQILSAEVSVDTTYFPPVDLGNGHSTPEKFLATFTINLSMKYGHGKHRLEATIRDGNGEFISKPIVELRGTFDTTLVVSATDEEYLKNFDILKGATMDVTITSDLDQYVLIGSEQGANERVHVKLPLKGRTYRHPITF